jgi:hypothetical protein
LEFEEHGLRGGEPSSGAFPCPCPHRTDEGAENRGQRVRRGGLGGTLEAVQGQEDLGREVGDPVAFVDLLEQQGRIGRVDEIGEVHDSRHDGMA